jgi:hypothetical protein
MGLCPVISVSAHPVIVGACDALGRGGLARGQKGGESWIRLRPRGASACGQCPNDACRRRHGPGVSAELAFITSHQHRRRSTLIAFPLPVAGHESCAGPLNLRTVSSLLPFINPHYVFFLLQILTCNYVV